MLGSLYILLGIVAVWYILYWSIRNDKVSSIKEQTGWLRMKNDGPKNNPEATEKKGKWKPRRTIEKEKANQTQGLR
jgi:hypothetical protein